MCLAIPAQILVLEKYSAKIDIMGIESKVNIELIEDPKVGDYILVHAGFAIQRIDAEYFEELQKIFNSMLEVKEKDE
jgi:hydrogenase expression/formation protein HypC